MRLINPERLIEDKGFFIEDERGGIMCVVAAQDIRNAPDAVTIYPAIPGHTDQHNIAEMAYKNGYAKGCEVTKKQYEALKAELQFTRQFIHNHGLEFELASAWEKAGQSASAVEEKRGHWITHGTGVNAWTECSECRVCGSPQWKVCPVCETKMDRKD